MNLSTALPHVVDKLTTCATREDLEKLNPLVFVLLVNEELSNYHGCEKLFSDKKVRFEVFLQFPNGVKVDVLHLLKLRKLVPSAVRQSWS